MSTAETSARPPATPIIAVLLLRVSLSPATSSAGHTMQSCASTPRYHRCVSGETPPILSKYDRPFTM